MTTFQHLATLRRLASDALRFSADEREALLWAAERVERGELEAVREPGGAIEECDGCGGEGCGACYRHGYKVVSADDAAEELARHNAEYDRWEAMTGREREDAIRWAML